MTEIQKVNDDLESEKKAHIHDYRTKTELEVLVQQLKKELTSTCKNLEILQKETKQNNESTALKHQDALKDEKAKHEKVQR